MSTSLDSKVAEELRAELARQLRSKRSMAAALALPPSTVNRWLNGQTPISLSELDAMCQVLGITIPDLLGRIPGGSTTPPKEPGPIAGFLTDTSHLGNLRHLLRRPNRRYAALELVALAA